jgi:carbamoyltransferase
MGYFDFATGLRMTGEKFERLFGGPPHRPEDPPDQRTMDIAASIQKVTDEVVLRMARTMRRETGERYLCLAGGVALNCVSNAVVLRDSGFDDLWIQPAAGDAGGAVGAALIGWHQAASGPRVEAGDDGMRGAYLGPEVKDDAAEQFLVGQGIPHRRLARAELTEQVAALLADGKVVGWMQGRMEFGPRALGNRSILADPRSVSMQRDLNLKIKFRESFRPFAPSVLAERAHEFFDLDRPSPYMLLIAGVRGGLSTDGPGDARGLERLRSIRGPLPAITHVDGSARLQTVHRETNPGFHALIEAFARRTGVPVLVITSFNVRGEPIVCTPADAYRCFMGTAMDVLVMGTCLLLREEQPASHALLGDSREFEPD